MPVVLNVHSRELLNDLGGRFVLCPAGYNKPVSQIALHPYTKTVILHSERVYPMDAQCARITGRIHFSERLSFPLYGFLISKILRF